MNRPPSPDPVDGARSSGSPGRARAVHRSRVEWMDTDAAGPRHNTAIMRHIEAAEAALTRACGITGYLLAR